MSARDFRNRLYFKLQTAFVPSYTPNDMSLALYPLASLQQIEKTPSREDGIPAELEEDLRAYGCKLIQQAGILLKQCVLISLQLLPTVSEKEKI